MATLVIWLALGLGGWLIIRRIWGDEPVEVEAGRRGRDFARRVRRMAGRWRRPFRPEPERADQFREWALRHLPQSHAKMAGGLGAETAAFALWLERLSKRRMSEYVESLSIFCRAIGIEPENWWAEAESRAEDDAEVRAVLLHCLAHWKSDEAAPSAALARWHAAPEHPRNRPLGQRLFARLESEGLAKSATAMISAPEHERRAFAARVIRQAAESSPDRFLSLLAQTVAGLQSADRQEMSP